MGLTLWLTEVRKDLEYGLAGFIESWESCKPKMKVLSHEILKLKAFKSF